MMRLLLLASVLFLLSAAACGGNGDGGPQLTLEEYLLEVGRLDSQFEQREANVVLQFTGAIQAAQTDEEGAAVYRDAFAGFAETVGIFVDGLDGLNPPDEAADLHAETLESGREVVAVFDALVDQAEDVASPDEAEALAGDLFSDESFDRFDESCAATQALADENGIEIGLNCDE